MCIRKKEIVSYLQYVHDLVFVHQKDRTCMIHTLCLWSRFCVSERGKLHHVYSMFIFYMLCIRKKETVSYLQYVHDLDFVHQKDRTCMIHTVCSWLDFVYQKKLNCIIPTICLYSIFCVSERGKLSHTYSIFMFLILCIRKYQKERNFITPTVCSWTRFWVSERGKQYDTYSVFSI